MFCRLCSRTCSRAASRCCITASSRFCSGMEYLGSTRRSALAIPARTAACSPPPPRGDPTRDPTRSGEGDPTRAIKPLLGVACVDFLGDFEGLARLGLPAMDALRQPGGALSRRPMRAGTPPQRLLGDVSVILAAEVVVCCCRLVKMGPMNCRPQRTTTPQRPAST